MSMQAAMKELRSLKQEETAMVNLASKISDQLNRLKVEELALQNLVRLQNEADSMEGVEKKTPDDVAAENETEDNAVPLDLYVNRSRQQSQDVEEEEEESEEEKTQDKVHDDIEQFMEEMAGPSGT